MQQLHLEKIISSVLHTKLKAKSKFEKEEKKIDQYCKTTAYSGLTATRYGAVAINHHPVWPWSSAEGKVEDTTFLSHLPKASMSRNENKAARGQSARQKLFHFLHASGAKHISRPKPALINLLRSFGLKCLNCSFVLGRTLLFFIGIY